MYHSATQCASPEPEPVRAAVVRQRQTAPPSDAATVA